MFRKDEACYFIKSPIIYKMDQIGIGVSVTMLPSILDVKNRDRDIYVHCHKHHVDIIKYFIDEDNIYPFYDSNNAELNHDRIFVGEKSRLVAMYASAVGVPAPHRCHPVDHFFHVWHGEINVDISRKNYPRFPVEKVDISKFNLPEKFVAIGPGSTKPICEMPLDTIKETITYCKSKGYEVVVLGDNYDFSVYTEQGKSILVRPKLPSSENFDNCINLIEKTKLDELIAILDKAHCYIGPEGGLMHFCGMTNTPMVIGINGWHPDMRMPYRNNELGWECYPVIPDEDLECRFCIQKTFNAKTVNIMMECIYGDFKCVSQMHFNKFKLQLDKLL